MTNCKGMNPKTISILAVLLLGANILTTATADPLQIIFTDQPNQITIGSEVHLTCVVSGGNDPHVTWISPTGLLPVNSHITNGGRTLLITNYDVTENGQYICVASDGQEFANHVFTLSAQHTETHPTATTSTTTTTSPTTTAPTTTTTSATTHSATHAPRPPTVLSMVVHPTNYHYGGDVHIVCTVESNPPHTMLGWNMMTDPNHIPSNIHLNYGTNKVTVNIKHLTDANIGKYQCFVRNSLGQDAQSFLLHPPK
ncbi:hemicentin-1-like [Crassostrea virginica]